MVVVVRVVWLGGCRYGGCRNGGCGEGGWSLSVGMLAVVEKVVRMAWFVEMRVWLGWLKGDWSKITIAKEKRCLKDHSPVNTNNSL